MTLGKIRGAIEKHPSSPENKALPLTIDVKVLYALSARATKKQGEDRRTMTDELSVDMLVRSALSEEAFSNKFLHNKPKQPDYAQSVI